MIDPLRGDYFFISLNDNLIGAEQYLSDCLNQYPDYEQYLYSYDFQTQRINGLSITTIEPTIAGDKGPEDALYAHVCGIGMLCFSHNIFAHPI